MRRAISIALSDEERVALRRGHGNRRGPGYGRGRLRYRVRGGGNRRSRTNLLRRGRRDDTPVISSGSAAG